MERKKINKENVETQKHRNERENGIKRNKKSYGYLKKKRQKNGKRTKQRIKKMCKWKQKKRSERKKERKLQQITKIFTTKRDGISPPKPLLSPFSLPSSPKDLSTPSLSLTPSLLPSPTTPSTSLSLGSYLSQ